MDNLRQFAKARSIADTFEALAVIVNRNDLPFDLTDIVSDEGLACIRAELEKIAKHLETKDAGLAAFLLAKIANRPHMGLPASTGAPASPKAPLMVKAPAVKWAKTGKGEKKAWTSKWQGFQLRVEWTKPEGEVVFVGSIDGGEPITRGKVLSRVQGYIEEEGLRRLTARAK